jgi:hypothetical protein
MAVTRGPLSNLPPAVQGKINIGRAIVPSARITAEPSPTPNRDDLDKALQSSLEKIAVDTKMTPEQKQEAATKAYQIAKKGESKPSLWGNISGVIGTAAKKAVIGPVAGLANQYAGLIKPLTNTSMAIASELSGLPDAYATLRTEEKRLGKKSGGVAVTIADFLGLDYGSKVDPEKQAYIISHPEEFIPSWERFKKNAASKEHYNPFFTEGKFQFDSTVDKLIKTVYFQAVADPLTYAGVGAIGASGRAGRMALAVRLVEKYGDAVDAGRIIRYGASGVPKTIREAEGIATGIRYAGKIVPYTGGVEKGFAGSRAFLGDIVFAGKGIENTAGRIAANPIGRALETMIPRSVKGVEGLRSGFGRTITDSALLKRELVQFAMTKSYKGTVNSAEFLAKQSLMGFADRQKELLGRGTVNRVKGVAGAVRDKEAVNIYKYLEMPKATVDGLTTITPELKQLVSDIRDWQSTLRLSANADIVKFGDDFGTNIKEIGFIDDYVHHKLSKKAIEWLKSEAGRKGEGVLYKSSDMSARDLTESTGAIMFRKLRGEYVDPDTGLVLAEEFFGVPVRTGSVDEINQIFAKAVGDPDAKWFETDMVSIMDSYSYSINKVRGRVAATRRAMDFGDPEVIRPLIKKVIPDAELVTKLEAVYAKVLKTQTFLRNRIQQNKIMATDYARSGANYAKRFLSGQLKTKALTTQEITTLSRRLDEALARLTQANVSAATKTVAKRGEFTTIHSVLVDEIANLRAAINNPERYAATVELRNIYLEIYPNHNPATLTGKTPEWLAEKIMNSKGMPATRELRVVNTKIRELREEIDAIPDGREYAQLRAEKADEYYELENIEQGFTTIAETKANATYANDGLLYGDAGDLIELPEEAGYKVFRTKPRDEGFNNFESSVAMDAVPDTELVDLRNPIQAQEYFSPDSFGEDMGFALAQKGLMVEGEEFSVAYRQLVETGAYDPQLVEFYPEVANLVDTVYFHARAINPAEAVSEEEIKAIFNAIDERIRLIPELDDPEDVDIFAREVMEELWGASAFRQSTNPNNSRRGLLVPRELVDDIETVDEWAVIFPHNETFPQPSMGPSAPVRNVKDNVFVQRILSGEYEQASLEVSLAKAAKEEEFNALESALLASIDKRAELKSLSGRKGGLTASANRRLKKTEAAMEQLRRTDSIEINIGGVKTTLTRENAQRELVRMEKKYETALTQLDKEIESIYVSEGVPRIGSKGGAKVDAIGDYKERIAMLMNQAKVLKTWSSTTGTVLAKDIQDLHILLSARPPKGAAAGASAAWVRKVDRVLASVGGIQDPALRNAYDRVTTLLLADEARLAVHEAVTIPRIEATLDMMRSGLVGRMIDDTLEGWEEIANLGVMMPEEVLKVWKPNLEKLRSNITKNAFIKAYDYSVVFFKTYATSTVGFFVRNGMSATFMNHVAGVPLSDIELGFRAAYRLGQGEEAWLKFLSKYPPRERAIMEEAWKATAATGRGQSDELASPAIRGTLSEKVLNNKATKFIRSKNDFVERAVRYPMALDSLRRGQSFDEAVVRINRYHFDYSDLSGFDEGARKVIPFWIWTSRNVPLQMVERVVHPSAYSIYDKVTENSPVGDNIIMPKWIADYNPIAIAGPNGEGGQWVLTPDLPMVRLEQQLQQLTNPERLVGQMAPVIKLPFELIAGRQLGIDVGPFKEKQSPATGVLDKTVLRTIANAIGKDALVGVDPKTGELLLDERVPYVAQNLLPVLGQLNRVTGGATGGKGSYKERQLGNILNWLGVPARYIGPQQQESESYGRTIELAQYLKDLVKTNKMNPKK